MKFITTVAASLLVVASLTIAADQERAVERNEAALERYAQGSLQHGLAIMADRYRGAERMLGQERINAMNLRERLANLAKAYQAGDGERIMQAAERMLGQERINGNLRERIANLAKAYQAGHGERIMKALQAAERMLV